MQDSTAGPETRKLQKVGGGTYTVSIPKEWAREQSLTAGERVHLYPDGDGSLVVCRDDGALDPAVATVSVDVDGGDPFERVLSAAYAAGVERLTLTTPAGFDAAHRRRVQRLVRERTGMRVAEATEEAVTVETLLDDGQVSIERTVVQLQFVALSLFRTAVDAAVDAATVDDERVRARRDDAAGLLALVTRQFERSLSRPSTVGELDVDRTAAFARYRTARALEGVAGAAADVATAVADCDRTPVATGEFRSVADETRLFVEDATSAVVDGDDVDAVRECYRTGDDVAADIATLERESAAADAACRHARELVTGLRTAHRRGEEIVDVAYGAAIDR